jgi:hypothetical protein
LDTIYFALPSDKVRPISYGKDWQLKDAKNNRAIKNLGRGSSHVRSKNLQKDDRSLKEVGVNPGMRLLIYRPSKLKMAD